MTFTGAPDFQSQNALTVTEVASLAVDIVGLTAFDITAAIQPYHQLLLIFWDAAFIDAGASIVLQVGMSLNGTSFRGKTLVGDGNYLVVPFSGQLITENAGNTLSVNAQPPDGGPAHITGTLTVLAFTTMPFVIPITTLDTQPSVAGATNVSVASGGTSTILPAPPTGEYYRVKMIGMTTGAALPAAGGAVTVREIGSTGGWWQLRTTGAAQSDNTPCDIITTVGLEAVNAASAAVFVRAVAEAWPV